MAASATRAGWAWFLAWLAVGAAYALSVLGMMTIGIFVLPIAVIATVILATRRHATDGLAGLSPGVGLALLYIAFLNRAGPGTICTANSGGGTTCVEQWSPWPWLVFGVALVVGGAVPFAVAGRQRSQPSM